MIIPTVPPAPAGPPSGTPTGQPAGAPRPPRWPKIVAAVIGAVAIAAVATFFILDRSGSEDVATDTTHEPVAPADTPTDEETATPDTAGDESDATATGRGEHPPAGDTGESAEGATSDGDTISRSDAEAARRLIANTSGLGFALLVSNYSDADDACVTAEILDRISADDIIRWEQTGESEGMNIPVEMQEAIDLSAEACLTGSQLDELHRNQQEIVDSLNEELG